MMKVTGAEAPTVDLPTNKLPSSEESIDLKLSDEDEGVDEDDDQFEDASENSNSLEPISDISKDTHQDDASNKQPAIKCSAVHTMERNMPDYDYSHLIEQLRAKIFEEFKENPGYYSEFEHEKCKNDDWYLSRFLLRQKMDVDLAFNMITKAMRFNRESLCNSIRICDFPAEFFKVGGMFGYEPDRKGNLMLYCRVKIHRKVPEIKNVFYAFVYYNIHHLDQLAGGKGELLSS